MFWLFYSILFLFILFYSFVFFHCKKIADRDQLSWFYTLLMGHNPCDLKNIVNNNILCM